MPEVLVGRLTGILLGVQVPDRQGKDDRKLREKGSEGTYVPSYKCT